METILYIVRHGFSVSNAEKIFTGHTDVPLSELGVKQAKSVTEYFNDKDIDVIYSSDLVRAYDTVKGVAQSKNLEVIKDKNLREIFAGEWEGKSFRELAEKYPDYLMWRTTVHKVRTTGGESVMELANRVYNEVLKIAKAERGKRVLIGTHATPLRALIAKIGGGSFEKMQDTPWFPNCAIFKVSFDGEKFTVLDGCITEHLNDNISNLPPNV